MHRLLLKSGIFSFWIKKMWRESMKKTVLSGILLLAVVLMIPAAGRSRSLWICHHLRSRMECLLAEDWHVQKRYDWGTAAYRQACTIFGTDNTGAPDHYRPFNPGVRRIGRQYEPVDPATAPGAGAEEMRRKK